MSIKSHGGIFGRNPTFNTVTAESGITVDSVTANGLNIDSGTLFVDADDNFVGVGTESPSSKLHLQGSSSGYIQMFFEPTANTDVASIDFRNAANAATQGYVLYDYTNNYMGFRTNGSGEAMRIDSSQNLDMTNGGGNIIMASGSGIDFSATANSSGTMSNELFDDYEEGDWTPVLEGSTSNPDVNYFRAGKYTKIGNVVHAFAHVQTTAINSQGSGDLFIAGLPFVSGNTGQNKDMYVINIGEAQSWPAGNAPSGGFIPAPSSGGNTYIKLFKYDSADPRDDLSTSVDASNLTTGQYKNELSFSITYRTS